MPAVISQVRLQSSWEEIDRIREKSLEAFTEKLKEREGDNLLRVILFGSVARGDSRKDSDLDVFVLVKKGESFELGERIVGVAVDVELEEGNCKAHISPFINTLKEYERGAKIGIPVFTSIEEEGIVLYDAEY